MKIFYLVLVLFSHFTLANGPSSSKKLDHMKGKNKEVVENPTLKTLSGSLNKYSFYSRFTYKGGSLHDPQSAERPNIRELGAKPNLVNMSGVFGLKYRLTQNDNLSFQLGLYATTPFHSSLDTNSKTNQNDFEKNSRKYTSDDPILSYFRTYKWGRLQNISFFQYQYITRKSYRDYGGRGVFRFSQASAYKINKAMYLASTLTYENYAYDKDFIDYFGKEVSIRSQQSEHTVRANISSEFYISQKISLRVITDLFSFVRYRDADNFERINTQQTLGMTYFFSRNISLAPNIKFISSDLRSERTNFGVNLTVNI
ncbi:MAG: hypothetical protein QF441_08720 [Bacteriovoracaceae bacterium]|jgi:hypothetical protein|nr:hypothetical protein [Bacteriovoracaceae bacterium]